MEIGSGKCVVALRYKYVELTEECLASECRLEWSPDSQVPSSRVQSARRSTVCLDSPRASFTRHPTPNCLLSYSRPVPGTHLITPWFETSNVYGVCAELQNASSVTGTKNDLQMTGITYYLIYWF